MTFSREVKSEIISTFDESNNELSILCGALLSAGSLVISNKKMSFTLTSEIIDFLKAIEKIIKRLTGESEFFITSKKNKYSGNDQFTLAVSPETGEEILSLCGIIARDEDGHLQINYNGDEHLLAEKDDEIAYLASSFVGGGSISIPDMNEDGNGRNSGYHMEWTCQTVEQAERLAEILASFDILSKKVERNNEQVVYIKEGDAISDVLKLIKAPKAVLELENQRVSRDVRNLANRQANCTVANIEKSVSAAQKQIDAIMIIDQTIGLKSLPSALKEIATLRLANPESSLTELGMILKKPISKAAVNQRFKKIIEISKEVGNG